MVVYADVLIFLNTIVNFFLLLLCAKIALNKEHTLRIAFGAFVGALFSLYIFLPQQNIVTEIIVRVVCSALIILISFGFINFKKYLKNIIVFFIVSFIYAGAMLAIWILFKPNGMIIRNSVVYFNFSPLLLIILSVVFYLFIIILKKLFAYKISEKRLCDIKLFCISNSLCTIALLDSGHNVTDLISDKDIIFLSSKKAKILFGDINEQNLNPDLKNRYRLIPCQTVTNSGILTAFRCDYAEINYNNRLYKIDSPIVAITDMVMQNDYSAIVNPQIIEKS